MRQRREIWIACKSIYCDTLQPYNPTTLPSRMSTYDTTDDSPPPFPPHGPSPPLPPPAPSPVPGTSTDIGFAIILLASAALIIIFILCFLTNSKRTQRTRGDNGDGGGGGGGEPEDEYAEYDTSYDSAQPGAFKLQLKLPATPQSSLFALDGIKR